MRIDIDHVKQINDAHGHGRGDEVLRGFATLRHQRVRRSDIVCRFGGEEVLLPVDSGDDFESLVRIADARTYRAKSEGRARTCFDQRAA